MELNVPFGMKKAMGTNHMKHATNVCCMMKFWDADIKNICG